MTKQELEEKLLGAIAELRTATADLAEKSREWAVADHKYRHAKAVAYLATTGTVAERSAHVDKACDSERERAHAAEVLREALREKVRALCTEVTAYQTLASVMKSEMQMEGRYNA